MNKVFSIIKMMQSQPKIYNINTFGFYRRQVKQKDLDKAFIKLIEKEEQRIKEEKAFLKKMINNFECNSKSKKNITYNKSSNNRVNNSERNRYLNLNLIFPKISIERINKIRDLFIEFDVDKNRTFDKDEIYLMFNTNKIPITKEEVIDLFGFNKRKKFICFNEFINLTVNEDFSNKFTKLIMEKLRYRCNESDICPNDFNDMLSHLCEFGKLSPELKEKTRNEQIKNKKQNDYKILDNENKNQKNSNINETTEKSDEKKEKDEFDFNNEKDINEIRENPNLLKREKEYNNFMEISDKKYLRFKEFLIKANIRDKILKKQKKLSKSVKIINKINPEIAKNYISYYPTENVFKNPNNNTIISFKVSENNQKYPNILSNNTENNKRISLSNKKVPKNLYFHIHYKNNNKYMKLVKNKNLKNNPISLCSNKKRNFEKFKEREYISLLANLTINNPDISPFQQNWNNPRYNYFKNLKNKNIYTENFFKTTGFFSNLNKL